MTAGESARRSGRFKTFPFPPLDPLFVPILGGVMLPSVMLCQEVFHMSSGGARARSGPAPDPMALRRDRKDDAGWVILPAGGFAGPFPVWPLGDPFDTELAMWERLWRLPQAVWWRANGFEDQVASYVRKYLEANKVGASVGLLAPVAANETRLGLNSDGLRHNRLKFSEDELGAKRAAVVPRSGLSAKDRLAGLKNAK